MQHFGFMNMDSSGKIIASTATAIVGSLVGSLAALIMIALLFILVDFITGVWASSVRAQRKKEDWAFESKKVWHTIYKTCFALVGIVLAELFDLYLLPFGSIQLAKFFTAFVCGAEFWSYLENAAEISRHPIFRYLRKFMGKKIQKELDIDITEINENDKEGR